MDQEDRSDRITAACKQPLPSSQDSTANESSTQRSRYNADPCRAHSRREDMDLDETQGGLRNGTCEVETIVALHCPGVRGDPADRRHHLASNDVTTEFAVSDLSLPEVCISTNSNSFEENMNYEVQQAYRIFTGFLLDKHKGIASLFHQSIGQQDGVGGVGGPGPGQGQLKRSMCLRRIEQKFIGQEYETITDFVADFRLMLENCYRYHGVDHWVSKQAQKLEIMLEQKLTLLSRTLREKTTLAVTSKGRFGAEEERGSGGTSTRRRLAPRSLATLTVGGHESIMVQTLRLEEQQRAKEERRQRELEKKEAEEMSAKEVEEWEQSLLSQASPHTVDTLWELPAIGHFLCLAQTALNLPEIVFFELERCLLMPRCSVLLSKIMSSLLSPWQKRATLHRRPAMPYRRWESELRQRVLGWYRAVGGARKQAHRAEQLGLCHQFFATLGEVSPLEEKPFHLLPFHQRAWLLKGLCDHVYETQKDVQDAVLAQPIHECRESILGYDSKETAYIHFPHFCGADLRIYRQTPSTPPLFPFPSAWVKSVEAAPGTEGEESEGNRNDGGRHADAGESELFGKARSETFGFLKRENGDREEAEESFKPWSLKKEVRSESGSSEEDSSEDSKSELRLHASSPSLMRTKTSRESPVKPYFKGEASRSGHRSKPLAVKQERGFSPASDRTIKAETREPCLSVGEHCYTGRSPARSANAASPTKPQGIKKEGGSPGQEPETTSCSESCQSQRSRDKPAQRGCDRGASARAPPSDRATDKKWTKKKKWKKKRGREQLPGAKGEKKQLRCKDEMNASPAEAAKPAVRRRVTPTLKRRDRKKKQKMGKKPESTKRSKDESPAEPSFKLVCTNLEELRELISKTEDELDDLESTKKRLGRWYYKREAVKDLHSTLIRLLNELSPWEPKLVKAHQRNRLRLKKEFDDFKKHPDYDNFVREECASSSSSSSDDDDEEEEESGSGKDACALDHYRRSEEEDQEHVVPRGLWSGASTRELAAETARERTVTSVSGNHLDHAGSSARGQTGGGDAGPTPDSGSRSGSEPIPSNQSRDPSSSSGSVTPARYSPSPRIPILRPTTGLPKGYTPIPTLLARSVGNKVTLMKRPVERSGLNHLDGPNKGSPSGAAPTSAAGTAELSKAQRSPSHSQQNTQRPQGQGQRPKHILRQPGTPLLQSAQAKPVQTVPKTPVQVVYKVPEGLGHIVSKDGGGGGPVKIAVHPVLDQNTGDKIMQQVVILPANLLVHKAEEKCPNQQHSKDARVPAAKATSPLCMSTNVPGFTIPESDIPVQQTAALNDAKTAKTPLPSVSPCQPAASKGRQVCGPKASAPQPSPATPAAPVSAADPKQELKTVCIRDSQSILVTTRGGNTGIVKVQTSADQGALGALSGGPVITISPQFKAFLVSKTSPSSTSAPSHASSCAIPAPADVSVAPPPKPVPSLLNPPLVIPAPAVAALTGSVSAAAAAAASTFALSQGSNMSGGSTVSTKVGQLVQASPPGAHFQPSSAETARLPSPANVELTAKPGVKRAGSEERSPVTKFILLSPSSSSSSSSASNVAASQETPSVTKPVCSSKVMFLNQPAAASPGSFVGAVSKQAAATPSGRPPLSAPLSAEHLRAGLSLGRPGVNVNSEAKTVALPAGVQFQFPGKAAAVGQTAGVQSPSPSKGAAAAAAGNAPATAGQLLSFAASNTITSRPAQLVSHLMLTGNSHIQGIPSYAGISKKGSSACPAAASSKDPGLPAATPPVSSPAQVTSAQTSPTQASAAALVRQPASGKSGPGDQTDRISSSAPLPVTQSRVSVSSPTTNPFSPAAGGAVQQRIVINTSAPLAGGTQIFLNNSRFVVPPQGLGPGSHVLIISSPAPQKVPSAGPARLGSAEPAPGGGRATVAPPSPVAARPPARPPPAPATSCPFVACTPAVGPTATPGAVPVQPGSGSTSFDGKTSAAPAPPRPPASQRLSAFASTPINPPNLVSSRPRPGGAPGLGPASTAVGIGAGAPAPAPCSSTVKPAVAPPPPRPPPTTSPSPVLPSPFASTVPGSPFAQHLTPPPKRPEVQMAAVDPGSQIPAPSVAPSVSLAHMGVTTTTVNKHPPAAVRPALVGTRTHVSSTVASRTQAPPLGSSVHEFQPAPVTTTPLPGGASVAATRPTASPKTNVIRQAVILTGQAPAERPPRAPPFRTRSEAAPKLLISPDGAVLSTVPCQPARRPEPPAAPTVSSTSGTSSASSTGALQTHGSSAQPPQSNTE